MKLMKLAFSSIAAVTLTTSVAMAAPMEALTNGGFETGTLAGWTATTLGTGTCPSSPRDWNVSTSGTATGCTPAASPSGSTFAAYVMNDGTGPLTFSLSQDFTMTLGAADAAFSFDLSQINRADAARTLTLTLFNLTDSVSEVLYSASTSSSDASWHTLSGAVSSSFIAASGGDSMRLQFDNFIPSTWTGPAGLGVDNVSLSVTTVPAPASLGLVGIALLGLFAARRRAA